MLSNITALKTVKENTNKVVLDAMPGILFESANKGQNRQKFFPHGEEETILVVVDDSFARRLAYLSTNLTKRLVLLNNKTDGFFGPEIRNVEGKTAPYAWRQVIKPMLVDTNGKFYDGQLSDVTYEMFFALMEYTENHWDAEAVNATEINHSVWAIVCNTASAMQQDKRFLHQIEVSNEAFLDVAACIYNDLMGFVAREYKIFKQRNEQ